MRGTITRLARRLRALLRRRTFEAELDDEIRFHLDQEIERNRARGMTPAEARRQALLAFGGVDRTKEEVREARGFLLLAQAWQRTPATRGGCCAVRPGSRRW